MPKIQVDGREVEVAQGATVMDAATRLGIYVPHFCWHKKLSIAANCRMCLVEVEKAPKPMPACATPATEGMKVWTNSPAAKKAQTGVMEFLLINHPLDCPICDQGGECQLQDLAVGYGASNSRYAEEKRVVLRKELGPLVAAEEMSRCIQCTRCVRFGQEIAGIMELGLAGRGENAEIVSFVGRAVESELSGNMIDLCPVGALTSEPFRYKARTWELTRRRSISPHDSLGSNLVVQVKQNKVMRVLPLDNEAVNECWLSDKDRFSYEGLNSPDRLTRPMVKRGGRWEEVDWEQAFDAVVDGLKGQDFGVLASAHATLEELFLAGKLGPADFRLRHADFSADGKREGIPWLGMPIAELQALDRVLVVGSFLRKDAPLLAHRLRQAAKRGAQVHMLHSVDEDWLMPVASRKIVPPSELANAISSFAELLKGGRNAAILLGNFAQQHPQAAQIHAAAQALADATDAKLGFLGEAANSVGGYLAGLPTASVDAILQKRAFVLLNVEPELDCADPQKTLAALKQGFVVSLTSWKHSLDVADVLLPVAPFTESSGTFVNTEGRAQSFHATVNALGEARPGWKVLRVLGSLLGLPGFEYDTIEQVRSACLKPAEIASRLSNRIDLPPQPGSSVSGIQRIADVPIYFADPLARRSPPLQKTRDARPPRAWMNSRLLQKLGVAAGQPVAVNGVKVAAALDDKLPDECVRIAAAHPSTAAIGPMSGTLALDKVAVGRAA
ncbi:MAG: NADH-quinone oxidoreductase subunit G [Betaproteobacteria bacterium RIFCSPLOWO2_12_FULL_65_14]|nr:MAG: NADH-quinone oxidoreductase subunit G [Betaproteobacteria bacterium RIFCSPLOWO2_12_FULL_65_14]